MIVSDDYHSRARHDCQTEYLPRMAKNRIHGTDGYHVMPFDFFPCFQDEHHQAFAFWIEVRMLSDMRPLTGGGKLVKIFYFIHNSNGLWCFFFIYRKKKKRIFWYSYGSMIKFFFMCGRGF